MACRARTDGPWLVVCCASMLSRAQQGAALTRDTSVPLLRSYVPLFRSFSRDCADAQLGPTVDGLTRVLVTGGAEHLSRLLDLGLSAHRIRRLQYSQLARHASLFVELRVSSPLCDASGNVPGSATQARDRRPRLISTIQVTKPSSQNNYCCGNANGMNATVATPQLGSQ